MFKRPGEMAGRRGAQRDRFGDWHAGQGLRMTQNALIIQQISGLGIVSGWLGRVQSKAGIMAVSRLRSWKLGPYESDS